MGRLAAIVVIGGGAAGLFASCVLADCLKNRCEIVLLEKEKRVGKKLLATGNGRCNLANLEAKPEDYGRASSFVAPAFKVLPPAEAIAYFNRLGLLTQVEETGKVYPLCNQSAAVLDLLRLTAEQRGVTCMTETSVTAISQKKRGLEVRAGERSFSADAVLVATGGMAAPQLSGGRESYRLLETLGHTLTTLRPGLVQLKTENSLPKALKGIKLDAVVALSTPKGRIGREAGELLFTEYGVSGPPVFQLSRLAALEDGQELWLELDFLPEFTKEEVREMLYRRRQVQGGFLLEDFLTGFLQKRLGQTLLKACGIAPLSRSAESLSDQELTALAGAMKEFVLPVTGTLGWKQAQITCGGVRLEEFDPHTLESRLVPGLYGAGEVLDVDGPCGGYNLEWAWASAYLAAKAMIKRIGSKP